MATVKMKGKIKPTPGQATTHVKTEVEIPKGKKIKVTGISPRQDRDGRWTVFYKFEDLE